MAGGGCCGQRGVVCVGVLFAVCFCSAGWRQQFNEANADPRRSA